MAAPIPPFQPPLQVTPAPATPLAFLGTFLLGWAFFGFTAQVAATFFLADPPWRRALVVGAPAAVVSTTLVRFPPGAILLVVLVVDAATFYFVYGEGPRRTAGMVLIHVAASLALVIALSTLIALLSTAPG